MIEQQPAPAGTPAPGPPHGRIGATLERRLDALRAQRLAEVGRSAELPAPISFAIRRTSALGERLATAVSGELVATSLGTYVRIETAPVGLTVARDALATIPSLPPPDARFVCLDTETTGLATAAGTVAFLVGLGWWEGDRFRQVQLLLPDHGDEPALLAALRELLPPDPWLVTYNGRAFDWPLLVARYRMGRDRAPALAGHLDLLPFVRRVFRHRLPDARLRTVERELLGLRRVGDVDGWEIPGRYLGFLRHGDARPLVDVVRHNDEDVRSLGRLVAHVAGYLGRPDTWRDGHPGDLAALAHALRRERRDEEALACLDAALGACELVEGHASRPRPPVTAADRGLAPTRATIAAERARQLARLRRHDEARAAWTAIAESGGQLAGSAWIEVAKLLERRLRDPAGALAATGAALAIAERSRALGRPHPALEDDVRRRATRLRRRLAAGRQASGRGDRAAGEAAGG